MKLRDAMFFEGEAHSMARRHHAVVTKDMAKHGGHTRPTFKEGEHRKFTGPSPSLLPGGAGHHATGRHGVRSFKRAGIGHHAKGHGGGVKHHHGIAADASPSDLASHHVWQEPSASDTIILSWRNKRMREKMLRRNMDPFEIGASVTSRPVTGPCGCTLALGDMVVVEGVGRGRITHRRERMLRVELDRGGVRVVDQKFVHQLKSA